jgi:RHH-type proline utilization regulon transcriptional repressor/proline dehydrogenase/delta 1-pyrroline-5-carboxylate dehydrogenase
VEISQTAAKLIAGVRSRSAGGSGVNALMREFSLSSQEGVALMCLAEALLRIPDRATADRLIRDKIGGGDWRAHLGHSPSLFVNAAAWGLLITGKLTATASADGLGSALTRLIARGGEPLIRRGVDLAMRLLGKQFVLGETIGAALAEAAPRERRGYRFSYDMLGEAALSAADAARYLRDYATAIDAIGAAARGNGVRERAGISVKLSALHPRYSRAQRALVMAELLPRLHALALRARRYDIGLNIDAEEADRLELSLDLLEALARDPALAGWDGIGFVVQAYQKRAPLVLEWLITLARETRHRFMVRLVKGAYWDSEIKRAQEGGLAGYPVFTRKAHTDVSYLACAQQMLAAQDAIYPQFATHNAQTAAFLHHCGAGLDWEYQCLHGMGETLYDQIAGNAAFGRACRIYAPVGTHETLLAYLVRRLLENGANSSFVNRVADPAVPVEELTADPVAVARQAGFAPHPRIPLPRDMYLPRRNSAGLDLSNEHVLASLAEAMPTALPDPPADSTLADVASAAASAAASRWPQTSAEARAAILEAAADRFEADRTALLSLAILEAGKTLPNAVAELREAVDFLRYYASQARALPPSAAPLGVIGCISPWNFPLAIFTGQIAAALAAGNTVLAKPAEQTPRMAARAVQLLHAAGVPQDALHLLPGMGETIGQAVTEAEEIAGIVFTGSTEVARRINQTLAASETPKRLIAETGGQNAMIVDSSALPEQVVADVIASAFDSAGQRCSALRVLYVQADIAERIIALLRGAMDALRVGDPADLATDIGPVIDAEAQSRLLAHIEAMRPRARWLHQATPGPECEGGLFVPPTAMEIGGIAELPGEVFGPVLHVIRYQALDLPRVLAAINATGYGLTFGVQSRIGETIAQCVGEARAGNCYVNRNMVGAVVGVQPFGGRGLSGTGPKAGGPLYVRGLTRFVPEGLGDRSLSLPGPTGETNRLNFLPRGTVLCLADTPEALHAQIGAARATGNAVLLADAAISREAARAHRGMRIAIAPDPLAGRFDAVLLAGSAADAAALRRTLAARPGPIVPVLTPERGIYDLERLITEKTITTNTAAAGGNASLLVLGG